jgi:hypothetical protein
MFKSRGPFFGVIAALALSASLVPATALAGDPCPIDISVNDLGSPADVDRPTLFAQLDSKRTWFGLSYGDSDSGPVMKAVHNLSPAEVAGLRERDRITQVNGKATATKKDVDAALDAAPMATPVVMTVTRKGADGAPDQTLELTVNPGPRDPVHAALDRYISDDECLAARTVPLDSETHAEAGHRVFSFDKGLRCKDAHKELVKGDLVFADGVLVLFRTSTDVLIAMPGVGTACAKAKTLDGDKLTTKAVERLFKKAAGPYVKQRMKNP